MDTKGLDTDEFDAELELFKPNGIGVEIMSQLKNPFSPTKELAIGTFLEDLSPNLSNLSAITGTTTSSDSTCGDVIDSNPYNSNSNGGIEHAPSLKLNLSSHSNSQNTDGSDSRPQPNHNIIKQTEPTANKKNETKRINNSINSSNSSTRSNSKSKNSVKSPKTDESSENSGLKTSRRKSRKAFEKVSKKVSKRKFPKPVLSLHHVHSFKYPISPRVGSRDVMSARNSKNNVISPRTRGIVTSTNTPRDGKKTSSNGSNKSTPRRNERNSAETSPRKRGRSKTSLRMKNKNKQKILRPQTSRIRGVFKKKMNLKPKSTKGSDNNGKNNKYGMHRF